MEIGGKSFKIFLALAVPVAMLSALRAGLSKRNREDRESDQLEDFADQLRRLQLQLDQTRPG